MGAEDGLTMMIMMIETGLLVKIMMREWWLGEMIGATREYLDAVQECLHGGRRRRTKKWDARGGARVDGTERKDAGIYMALLITTVANTTMFFYEKMFHTEFIYPNKFDT